MRSGSAALLSRPKVRDLLAVLRSMPLPARIGLAIFAVHVLITIAAPLLAPAPPNDLVGENLQEPSLAHWLGTDQLGRDVLSRIIYGGRAALGVALPAAALGVFAGAVVGTIAALKRGIVDAVVGRLVDTFLAVPAILILLIVVAGMGSGTVPLVLSIAAIYGVPSLRVTRAAAMPLVNQDFVLAARARGESSLSIAVRELAPNLRDVVLVELAVRASAATVLMASLSFLGLGVAPPTADWGRMISENASNLSVAWWATLAPLAALSSLVIGFSLAADGLSKALGVGRNEAT